MARRLVICRRRRIASCVISILLASSCVSLGKCQERLTEFTLPENKAGAFQHPTVSGDGAWFSFADDAGVWVVGSEGSQLLENVLLDGARDIKFSSSSNRLAVAGVSKVSIFAHSDRDGRWIKLKTIEDEEHRNFKLLNFAGDDAFVLGCASHRNKLLKWDIKSGQITNSLTIGGDAENLSMPLELGVDNETGVAIVSTNASGLVGVDLDTFDVKWQSRPFQFGPGQIGAGLGEGRFQFLETDTQKVWLLASKDGSIVDFENVPGDSSWAHFDDATKVGIFQESDVAPNSICIVDLSNSIVPVFNGKVIACSGEVLLLMHEEVFFSKRLDTFDFQFLRTEIDDTFIGRGG